jgi:AraC-like DNA-binding protein
MDKQKSILERFIEAVSGFTGMHMCVYDLAYFTKDDEKLNLPSALRQHCSPYCQKIKSNKDGWDRCIKDEYFRAAQAQKLNAPFLHTCHAGLTDLVVPIRRGGKQIGAIYLGQAVTGDKKEMAKTLARLVRAFEFDKLELRALLDSQPKISKRGLNAHADLLNGLRDYIELSEAMIAMHQVPRAEAGSFSPRQVEMKDVPTFFLDLLRPQSEPIQKAVRALKAGYWQKLSLARVAREVGLSESHFSREFQKELGFSFRKCLVETRINAALYLLKRSHLNVGQIAEMVGYEDVSSMGRAFRKQVGASPKQFLRMQPPPWLVDDLSDVHFSE